MDLQTEREPPTGLASIDGPSLPVPDVTFHALFEAAAARVPDRLALVCGARALTYGQLDAQANQLAHHLHGLGVAPGRCVALCLGRSAEMIVALLGIVKAGAAYVPLLPDSPRARLEQQLAETDAPVVVTEEKLLGALPLRPGRAAVCLDPDGADARRIAAHPTSSPGGGVSPRALVYVIYTSGSTGVPKGVAVRHDNVVNYTTFISRLLRLEEHDAGGGLSFATVSTLAADLGNTCIFPALASGGTLHVIDHETAMDGNLFAAYAREHPIDVLKITPSHLGALLAIPEPRDVLPRRYLVTGGEASTWALVAKVRSLSSLHWINHYGPTETTIGSLTFDLDREEASVKDVAATVPIGRPIGNTRLHVLDDAGQRVPPGEPGELYIAGRGVTAGYLKQPERTAERFIPEPGGERDARMYRTGDRVRELPGGAIEFLGRVDDQVKIRGFRVELGEIQSVLRRHPDVADAVVVAREVRPQDLRILAYFVPAAGRSVSTAALQAHAREQLPDAMVPSRFVALAALPLTPNGKVDRKALPSPEEEPAAATAAAAPPASSDGLEAQVTAAWKSVLGLRQIRPTDSFFDIGGHSLAAVHMLAELQKRIGKRVPNQVMLSTPTVEGIVAYLRGGGGSQARRSLVAIQPNGTRPPLFCIHGGGGEVFWYRDLSRRLGDDQPLYGLQARRDDDGKIRTRRVEQMAELYLAEIREAFPTGPYYLAGASFGGKVAYEIARMLRAEGETIALLAMFDTWGPGYPTRRPDIGRLRQTLGWIYQRLDHHLGSVWLLEHEQRMPYLKERLDRALTEGKWAIEDLVKEWRGKLAAARGAAVDAEQLPQMSFVAEASKHYEPKPYPGRVVLFRSQKQPFDAIRDDSLGWDKVAPALEIHELPGHHATMIAEPRVRYLAEVFGPMLAAAQAAHAVRR